MAASSSGVAPAWFAAGRGRRHEAACRPVSRSFASTAQCSAVVPSTWGALTSAFCWIRVRTAALSPASRRRRRRCSRRPAEPRTTGMRSQGLQLRASFVLIRSPDPGQPFDQLFQFLVGKLRATLPHVHQRDPPAFLRFLLLSTDPSRDTWCTPDSSAAWLPDRRKMW